MVVMVVMRGNLFKECFEMFGRVKRKEMFVRKSFLPDKMGLLGHLRLFPATTRTAMVIKKMGTKIPSHRCQPSCFYKVAA